MPPKKPVPSGGITLPPLDIRTLAVSLIGDSPLICHKWSEKAKKQMLDKMMKRAKQAREARDPEADFWESLYVLRDHPEHDVTQMQFGFPVIAFKNAVVDAASFVEGVTKVHLRGAMHLVGEKAVIDGIPTMREDTVRVCMGSADLRYRGEFLAWRTTLIVTYNAAVLSAEQIMHLFDVAGFSIGVGEWRPQRDGSYGRFHVARTGEVTP